jgi:diaminopimelate decarboxylase
LGFSGTREVISEIIDVLGKSENFLLTTLQLHIGTQLDDQIFRDGVEYLISIANQFEQMGISVSQLDFGGGFPEASKITEEELDNLFLLLYESLKERGWENAISIFEPGRYLIGDAGLLLTQIINLFEVEGERWIMLNTGTHHCSKFSNSKFRYELIDHMSEPHDTPISIAGCLPTDMDVFGKRYPFVKSVKKGDHLAILNAGAYTLSWSTRFSFPFPPMILVKNDQIEPVELPVL